MPCTTASNPNSHENSFRILNLVRGSRWVCPACSCYTPARGQDAMGVFQSHRLGSLDASRIGRVVGQGPEREPSTGDCLQAVQGKSRSVSDEER